MPHEVLDSGDALRRKEQFFNSFNDILDSDGDDVPDPGRKASIDAVKKNVARRRRTPTKDSDSNGLPRSASDTNLTVKEKHPLANVQIDQLPPSSSAGNPRLPASLMTRHTYSGAASRLATAAAPPTSTASKTTGKRKRDNEVALVPDEHQIFRGLHFYFFPNNDTNPARRLRIGKAREFGATWQKNFNDSVTHVVVDKTLDYTSLMRFLKLDALPQHIVLVSENYPADCLSYRALVDPKLPQFRVKGHEAKQQKTSMSGSGVSLQLKPAGRSVMARQPETQSSVERATTSAAKVSHETDNDEREEALQTLSSQAENHSDGEAATSEELDAAIKQSRELQNMPLDESDGDSRPTSSAGPSIDADLKTSLSLGKKKGKLHTMQDRFQCMHSHNGQNADNPNSATIAILDQMSHYYDRIGDDWRTRAYRKAIASLRKHPRKVCTKQEALALPQIGDRLATKIEEIAFTNRLQRLDNTKADMNDQILQTFMDIYGVGFAQASRWVDLGYTNLDELAHKAGLNTNQRIGVEHYEDFNSRIPRAEVEKHVAIVRNALLEIDPAFEVIVGGSHRRGAATSGDIDCIVTHTKSTADATYIRRIVLDQLVPTLFTKKFLVAELAATSRDDGSKWHGACRLPSAKNTPSNPWRRIDLLLVPPAERGAALIYFTGNDIFNRSLRLLASTKGMRLNQRGLYRDVLRATRGREKLTEGMLVEGRDERRIFEILGVPWREAPERNC